MLRSPMTGADLLPLPRPGFDEVSHAGKMVLKRPEKIRHIAGVLPPSRRESSQASNGTLGVMLHMPSSVWQSSRPSNDARDIFFIGLFLAHCDSPCGAR